MTFRAIDISTFTPTTVADQMQPDLTWASVDRLVIDERYQRQITMAGRRAIQRIAENWSWKKYQPILVAPADAGRLAVVDGQHRAHAAAVAGIEALPAMLVPMTPAEQAQAFVAVNTDRIKINPAAAFKAKLAGGDPTAIAASEAVAAAGCRLMTYNASAAMRRPGDVFSHRLFMDMIRNGEGPGITAGLRAIVTSEQGQMAGPERGGARRVYDDMIVRPWLNALATNQRFLQLDLAAVFDLIDWDDEHDRARQRARQTGAAVRATVTQSVIATLTTARQEAA